MKHCEKRFLNLYCIQIYICENFDPTLSFSDSFPQPRLTAIPRKVQIAEPHRKKFPITPYILPIYVLSKAESHQKKHSLSDNGFIMKAQGTIVCYSLLQQQGREKRRKLKIFTAIALEQEDKSTGWFQHMPAKYPGLPCIYITFFFVAIEHVIYMLENNFSRCHCKSKLPLF